MSHVYSNQFFDYIDKGARSSAQGLISHLHPWVKAKSVVDFGSGRGVWLDEWKNAGVAEVCGLDGAYVDQNTLAIAATEFRAVDLTQPVDLGRRFDLAQSLEVGEHLPVNAADTLVSGLVAHADCVLFSAAVKGQGGEFHVNEQPLSFWQAKFEAHGYAAYDCLRPALRGNTEIEPWYRYNSVLYANAAGALRLPEEVLATVVEGDLQDAGDMAWRMRKAVVSTLPQGIVTTIARQRAAIIARRAQKA